MSNGRSYKEKKKQIKTQTHKQLNHAGAPKETTLHGKTEPSSQ
jgi:hypothetical protein